MNPPEATIIILNYNGAQYLSDCLDAIKSQTYPTEFFEVIVSDNGSTDGSLELLTNKYPWVRILKNNCNLGFASGNNAAIKEARSQYIILLNNDTKPHINWLESMVNLAREKPEAGMITGHLQLFYDQITL
jgi:GT2 family glycosyltransferase